MLRSACKNCDSKSNDAIVRWRRYKRANELNKKARDRQLQRCASKAVADAAIAAIAATMAHGNAPRLLSVFFFSFFIHFFFLSSLSLIDLFYVLVPSPGISLEIPFLYLDPSIEIDPPFARHRSRGASPSYSSLCFFFFNLFFSYSLCSFVLLSYLTEQSNELLGVLYELRSGVT